MKKLFMGALFALAIAVFFPLAGFAAVPHDDQPMKDVLALMNSPRQHNAAEEQRADTDKDYHGVMGKVYERYFAIRTSLAGDSMENVSTNAHSISEDLSTFLAKHSHKDKVNALLEQIGASAKVLAEKDDIKPARSAFADLSDRLVEYQTKFADASEKAHVFFCDMVKERWLQEDTDIGNPYLGLSMLKCGREIK